MQLISNELRPSVLKRTVTQFDIQIRQISVGRALIAAAGLSIVQLTPYSALMQTVLGRDDGPGCSGLRAVSAYCIFKEGPAVLPTVVLTMIFTLALLGAAPAIVGWLHAWAAYSIAASIAIPDGGDQAAVVFLVLIAVACSGDRRRWAFGVSRQVSRRRRQVALAGLMALRIQVAMIYFDSAIGKVFATDWVTGTTEYYVIRDPYFGAWGPVGTLLRFLSENALITVTMTWGAMVLETLIAVLILCGPRARKFALLGCVALHGMIILSIGLWSFGLIMIGGVTIAALGSTPSERRRAQLRPPAAASTSSGPRRSTRPMPHRSGPTTI